MSAEVLAGLQWRLYLKVCVCVCLPHSKPYPLDRSVTVLIELPPWPFVHTYLTVMCLGLAGSHTLISSATRWPYVRVVIQLCVWTNESVCLSCCLDTVFLCVYMVSHCSPDRDSVAQSVCPLTRFGFGYWDTWMSRARGHVEKLALTHIDMAFVAVGNGKESVGACSINTEWFPLICSRCTGQISCFPLLANHKSIT